MTPRWAGARRVRPVLTLIVLVALIGLGQLTGCGSKPTTVAPRLDYSPPVYRGRLPLGFPLPRVPGDNPSTSERELLGRFLFYEQQLSVNQTYSCASCHQQRRAFTDGLPKALGATGESHTLNTMSLVNVAYNATYSWANPTLRALEAQALVPMTNQTPIELGLFGLDAVVVDRLRAIPRYPPLFAAAFPDQPDPISLDNAIKALAVFERSLISADSAYDRFVATGDPEAMSAGARRGMDLFFTERLACSSCHQGFNFSGPVVWHLSPEPSPPLFLNNGSTARHSPARDRSTRDRSVHDGTVNHNPVLERPMVEQGLAQHTRKRQDRGRFRVPTLRNIELTAPYMHDGSIPTLEAVLDHYSSREVQRVLERGRKGLGNRFGRATSLTLSSDERADLIAFLHSLTDWTLVENPRFSNPFLGSD